MKNPDISGAIFTLSLSIRILNSQCVEGARYVRVHQLTPIISYTGLLNTIVHRPESNWKTVQRIVQFLMREFILIDLYQIILQRISGKLKTAQINFAHKCWKFSKLFYFKKDFHWMFSRLLAKVNYGSSTINLTTMIFCFMWIMMLPRMNLLFSIVSLWLKTSEGYKDFIIK